MAILTNIIAAEEDELEAVGDSVEPTSEWSGIALRDFTIPKIATLHCVLTGDLLDDAYALYEPSYFSEIEGAIVLQLASQVIDRLASLDEAALQAVSEELMATEEFEYAGWGEEEIGEMLNGLSDLAQLAESQGQVLFAWLHPLRT
ncbi:MAG: hypothetical protein RBS28_04925 [Rhodocyclaceae bacterium]|jgi:hypothetical protein|nr:hypothetical protein [Rhodocyclaceae bacterium]